MLKKNTEMSKTIGLLPGTLVHIGESKTEPVKITIINYTKTKYTLKDNPSLAEVLTYRNAAGITWINIDGIHQLDIIEKIGQHFGLHPLSQADIANNNQRPKLEEFSEYLFIVLKMVYLNKQKNIIMEQVSLVIGDNFVLSFQENKAGDTFEHIRELLKNAKFRIKQTGADYLAYLLIDAIVDGYFTVIEKAGEDIDIVETKILVEPKPATLKTIHHLKRELILLRKALWPLRDAINWLQRSNSPLIKKNTALYLRDVYDHTLQVIESIEMYRDTLSGLMDVYLSSISYKLNEVMKVLTIISTIFIPLTYIAGVYGMNFKYLPELNWPHGYFLSLGLMATVAVGMIFYFRKKNWL